MKNKNLIVSILFAVIIVLILFVWINNSFNTNIDPKKPSENKTINYTYQIINVYPHDESAFTQGLVFEDGILYEGTGLYGESTLRKVDLETGNVTQIHYLSSELFGEGITIFENKIIQLTWKNNLGIVYDRNSFEKLNQFEYSTEGWGITHNGTLLIMSDGTNQLYFLDPTTYQTVNQIEVSDDTGPITQLNELEYINGTIYANIWFEDKIATINPETGKVTGWINLTSLKEILNQTTRDVLNGIAYDNKENRLFVTGKKWSKLFEIQLIPSD
jgi:glutamine cyclotransferase